MTKKSECKKKILIIYGGDGDERKVSIDSSKYIFAILMNLGYIVEKIDLCEKDLINKILGFGPDIVFNSMHGKFGEDGRLSGILDFLKIPYTHSGFLSSSVCFNKKIAKDICLSNDILTPDSVILSKENSTSHNQEVLDRLSSRSIVIKPISNGSSIGVKIFPKNDFDLNKYHWKYGKEIIVQEYIDGKEIHVVVLKKKALGAIELKSSNVFYDYESKYTELKTKYIIPPRISDEIYKELLDTAEKVHKLFKIKTISRLDFILNIIDNKFYLLDINTHPGFTDTSLVKKVANFYNIKFENIVNLLLKEASYNE